MSGLARKIVLLLFILLLLCSSAYSAKKVIEFGWDIPNPDFLRANIHNMEKAPFDGVIFRLDKYKHLFDTRPWSPKNISEAEASIRSIAWGSFKDNFILLHATNVVDMDWRNDEEWNTIVANLKLLAKVVHTSGCLGIAFDPEPYKPYGTNPWEYPGKYQNISFSKLNEYVRRRGAQFISALEKEVPNLRLLNFFLLSVFVDVINEPDPNRQKALLLKNKYALLPAFLDGILDAITADVRIIDGDELSYYFISRDAFISSYRLIKQKALVLIDPLNREKYGRHIEVGMAVYVDRLLALQLPKNSIASYYMSPEDRNRLLESNIYYALATSDEYVWCYGERVNWWNGQVPDQAAHAIRQAKAKISAQSPLGFDIRTVYRAAQLNQAIAQGLSPH